MILTSVSACIEIQIVCMHAWEFSEAISNSSRRKTRTFMPLKAAQVFSWPFQAIPFKQDKLKMTNNQSFTYQNLLFSVLAKTPGARVLDAC